MPVGTLNNNGFLHKLIDDRELFFFSVLTNINKHLHTSIAPLILRNLFTR